MYCGFLAQSSREPCSSSAMTAQGQATVRRACFSTHHCRGSGTNLTARGTRLHVRRGSENASNTLNPCDFALSCLVQETSTANPLAPREKNTHHTAPSPPGTLGSRCQCGQDGTRDLFEARLQTSLKQTHTHTFIYIYILYIYIYPLNISNFIHWLTETRTNKQTNKHFDSDALRSLCYSEHSPAFE